MKLAYFDLIGGASGDMILGALLDAGLPEESLRRSLAGLPLDNFSLHRTPVTRGGIRATRLEVRVRGEPPSRKLPELVTILQKSNLEEAIKQQAISMVHRLGEVEAAVHGAKPEDVHLHELGGVDTLVDLVGALTGLRALGVEKIYASPPPLGRGMTGGVHGSIPLPAPATLALLQGIPVVGSEIDEELVTPTGALILASLASAFGPIPPMILTAIGYGAGGRNLPIPNVVRLLIGESVTEDISTETLALLETNIDDMNPELFDYTFERLFAAGALDVTLVPVHMKKNRPGAILQVLCRPDVLDAIEQVVFAETSTLGIRQSWVTRRTLPRQVHSVDTPYGPIRVKVARLGVGDLKVTPEYEDCRQRALENDVPLRAVYQAAERSAAGLEAGKIFPLIE